MQKPLRDVKDPSHICEKLALQRQASSRTDGNKVIGGIDCTRVNSDEALLRAAFKGALHFKDAGAGDGAVGDLKQR